MRSKRLIVILVIPFFFMLRKYFAVARTRYLSHTYTQGMKRGFVKVYNYKTKHYLYNYGQKTWLYNPKIIPSFEVRFTAWSHKFLDEEKIEAKKQAALQSLNEDDLILTKREKELLPLMLTNPFTQKTNNNDYKLAHNFIKKVKHYWKYRDNPSDIPPQES